MNAEEHALLRDLGRELGLEVKEIVQDRRDQPELWYHFHDEMLRRLPRWRRLARAYHRLMRRRMRAFMDAKKQV